jgi:hypothetical protein
MKVVTAEGSTAVLAACTPAGPVPPRIDHERCYCRMSAPPATPRTGRGTPNAGRRRDSCRPTDITYA